MSIEMSQVLERNGDEDEDEDDESGFELPRLDHLFGNQSNGAINNGNNDQKKSVGAMV